MDEKHIYSRAYHKAYRKFGSHEEARKFGNQAVKDWLEQQEEV